MIQLRLPSRSGQGAFTLVEVALSLAIIAFALVAILGVLPSGMTVQRDNRWDTIINEDGQFWLNAIRQGAREVPELGTNRVISIETNMIQAVVPNLGGYEIIGLMSRPTAPNEVPNKAQVRAISSSAAEQGTAEVGLEYVVFSSVQPFTTGSPLLASNLYQVRLVFRWPAFPGGTFGRSKKVFRTLVRGQLIHTNGLHFFNSQSLAL